MSNTWKGAPFFMMLWISASLPARADDATAIMRNFGTIPSADADERLAQKLFALVRANPDDRLVGIEARIKSADDNSVTNIRYLFDREKRHLLVLRRTVKPKGGDFYHVSFFPDTDAVDFQLRLPVRAQKGYPKVSQSANQAEVVIPASYPDFPHLVDWP
jgi:hypothetical protein